MCWSLCIEPINEWGGSMGPNEGWQCNSISAQKKGAAFFRCQLCIVSVVTLSMRSFYIMFSIYIYMAIALAFLRTTRCLRDECVSYFRLWHVYLRTTYDG